MNEFIKVSPAQAFSMPSSAVLRPAILRGADRPDLLRDEVLAEIFAETASRQPGHVAMRDAERSLSYGAVWQRASAIAAGLASLGIGPGSVVGLWMPRGLDLLVSQIAITLAGAAWLPFDADAPLERIAVCLGDCAASGLITVASNTEKAADGGVVVWSPEALAESGAAAAKGAVMPPRPAGLTPDHPAYMIYTSGSTGKPKGIVVSHRNICHFLRSVQEVYGIRPDDVMFQGASVAFDLSREEIWVPYLAGASL